MFIDTFVGLIDGLIVVVLTFSLPVYSKVALIFFNRCFGKGLELEVVTGGKNNCLGILRHSHNVIETPVDCYLKLLARRGKGGEAGTISCSVC